MKSGSFQIINIKADTYLVSFTVLQNSLTFCLSFGMKMVFFCWKQTSPVRYTKETEAYNRSYCSFLDWKIRHHDWTWFNKNLFFPLRCPFFTPLLSAEFTASTWKITFLCSINSWQCLLHHLCHACKRNCLFFSLVLSGKSEWTSLGKPWKSFPILYLCMDSVACAFIEWFGCLFGF